MLHLFADILLQLRHDIYKLRTQIPSLLLDQIVEYRFLQQLSSLPAFSSWIGTDGLRWRLSSVFSHDTCERKCGAVMP
jgi:hypothetical protein